MPQMKLVSLAAIVAAGAWAMPAIAQQTTGSSDTTAPATVSAAAPVAPAQPVAAPAATATAPATAPAAPVPAAPVQVATPPAAPPAPPAPASLRIATWAGAYGQAQKLAVFDPFSKDTGTQIDATAHPAMSAVNANDWDVADLSAADAAELCDKGALESIDPSALKPAPDGTAAAADFLPGGLGKCSVGSLAWSAVTLYMADGKEPKTGRVSSTPKSIKDFFDVVHFPGKRGLPRDPRYAFELALMADGVATADVYTQLATEAGVKRALRSLSSIRSQIEWWTDPQQAIDLLKNRTVAMTIGFSGRAFMEIATGTKPIKILWDAQIYDIDVWAVSKSTHNKDGALKFVAYASASDRLADTARQLPYGPMRRSAVGLVGNQAVLGTDLKPFLPTTPDNFATALRYDGTFWRNHLAQLGPELEDWIENPPYTAGVGKDIIGPPLASK